MDIDRAYELLDRCTYKEGYNHFEIRPEVAEQAIWGAQIRVCAKVPDTYRPGSAPGEVVLQLGIPELSMLDDRSFLDAVLRAIEEFERHEAQEGFKVDGVMWKDPHKDKQLPVEGIRE